VTTVARRAAAYTVVFALAVQALATGGDTVRLPATADAWLSCFPGEEDYSAGRHPFLKLKSIQELAVVRFDAAPAAGREVLAARLFLRRAGSDMLRYLRVSTVNGDWAEGTRRERLGPGDGATCNHADRAARRPWAWPGSQVCDVIMTSGNTLAAWAEREEHADGWLSVALAPELVYALATGDTDGLAVMDGGTPAFHNNMVHSVQSPGSAPYIEAELGKRLDAAPARPAVAAEPAGSHLHLAHSRHVRNEDVTPAHLGTGALRITIQPASGTFCWRLKLDGQPVPRWQVKHPAPNAPVTFCLDGLKPLARCELEVVAVSPGGRASEPTKLVATASPALGEPPALRALVPPAGGAEPPGTGQFRVWACPPLIKICPQTGKALCGDEVSCRANAVWDGRAIRLFGARGETVSCQLVVENLTRAELRNLRVTVDPPATGETPVPPVELFKNWYVRNRDGRWQPAYCVPLAAGTPFEIPDPLRKLPKQSNQGLTLDLHIPGNARPGRHGGSVTVAAGEGAVTLPIELEVADFALPDTLCFWPQLNTYDAPRGLHDYYRLAHDHRCVLFYRRWQPGLRGAGKDIQVLWDDYDRQVGPLLSGEAFKACRRAGVPIEALSLPYCDSWPTPLTKQTYSYQGHWPGKGEDPRHLLAHYLTAPTIADALSRDYRDAFRAVQRQFIEHFRQKGWTHTEVQCLFVGKATHRTQYGVNMWWTTDEPYHWDDWQALRYFCRLWTEGRRPGEEKQWVARADISRPQWQGRLLDGVVDTVYFGTGAFSSPAMIRRCETLAREAPLDLRVYGSANADTASNLGSVAWIVAAWLHGASAALPWQAMGNDKALDVGDQAVGGNALLAPGDRFGVACVADLRLKAFREGQQIAEYLNLAGKRCKLNREQLRAMVARAVPMRARTASGAGADNADALAFIGLDAWRLAELRRALAELIANTQTPERANAP